tara:strand:+ start:11129 stop:11311 length:183 start_codon:yes stop_codon:yes gene_type:complete
MDSQPIEASPAITQPLNPPSARSSEEIQGIQREAELAGAAEEPKPLHVQNGVVGFEELAP